MKNQNVESILDNKLELKNLKVVEAKIYDHNCDIKGEPISTITADDFTINILFPTKFTPQQAEKYSKQISTAVNTHEELVQAVIKLKSHVEKIDDEFNDPALNDLLKQAEEK